MESGRGKNRNTDNKEDWISNAFGNASNEDIAWMCSINGGIHKKHIINEKLAWNIIDKAGLDDKAGLGRRRHYKRKQKCKYIIHVCTVCAVIAVLLVILSLNGVFDRDEILYYKYKAYPDDSMSMAGSITKQNIMENYRLSKEVREADGLRFPEVDEEMLDYTMYAVAAEYCVENNLSIDGYRIIGSYKVEEYKGEFLLLCDMMLGYYDINRNEHSFTGFNVIVYPNTQKSNEKFLAGTYIHHVKDSLTSREDSPVYRDIVMNLQSSEEGYFVKVEDRRGLNQPGCGNFFIEVFDGYEPSITTNFYINQELKEDKVYLFDRSVTCSNLIFEMEFKNGKLIMRYCREGEDIDSKEYMEMEE